MPYWAGMLTEEQHPHFELQQAIRQASWDLFFSTDPVCCPPYFVDNPGLRLRDILGETPLLVLDVDTPLAPRRESSGVKSGAALPITLNPGDPTDFLALLLQSREAWLEVLYDDGRREIRRWNASRMRPSSNIIGNIRSRPEFRAGAWQERGISQVRVSIDRPDS